MRKSVRKAVAKQVTEAVREVLNHYQRWLMNLYGDGGDRPADLIHEYGRLRKLRDYLRDLVRSQAQPELHVHQVDADLLASCCLFAVDCMETEMREVDPRNSRFRSLDEGSRELVTLARELSSGPIRWIDGPQRPVGPKMPRARAAIAELGMVEPEPKAELPTVPVSTLAAAPPAAPPAGTSLPGPRLLRDDDFPDTLWGERVPPPSQARPEPPKPEPAPPPTLCTEVLQQRIAHARLRNLAVADLANFEAAMEKQEFRLGAAFLYSVFEALVLDNCLVRRVELDLPRRQEQWEIEDVVPRICKGTLSPADLRSLAHLVDCRDYLFPRAHLSSPLMVTRMSLRKMREFVTRMIGMLEVPDATKREETSVAERSVRR